MDNQWDVGYFAPVSMSDQVYKLIPTGDANEGVTVLAGSSVQMPTMRSIQHSSVAPMLYMLCGRVRLLK